MKKVLLFLAVVLMGLSAMAQTSYTLVTSEAELSAGDKLILVGINFDEETAWAMSYQKSNNRHAIQILDIDDESITLVTATDPSSQTEAFEITLGGQPGSWTFFDELNNGYLYAAGGGNYLKTQSTLDDKGKWTLSMDEEGFVPVSNGGVEQNIMRYNPNTQNNSPLFGCYKPTSTIDGLVYIFKAGGGTINPEPTNYPVNFDAYAASASILLNWEDAVGAQLPRAYAIIGSTGSITAPVDGTPVANDLNGTDGHVAYNVMYGEESFAFENLPGNTTWTFAIFPYSNSGANIDYKNNSGYPTASATTADIYTLLTAQFANGLSPFTAVSVAGDQEWIPGVYNNRTYAVMNGYSSGSAHNNEDWLISQDLLQGSAYDNILISFSNAYKFAGNALQVLYSEDYEGGNPNNAGWVDITSNFEWSSGDYTWVDNTSYTLVNMADMHHMYLAFKYTSTDDAASAWEITDIEVYGSGYDDVAENEAVNFNIYPNPATDNVKVSTDKACELQILDMTGRMVMRVNVNEGENSINVADLNSGVYFVKMNDTVVKFVKR